jgi:hypothetical protein
VEFALLFDMRFSPLSKVVSSWQPLDCPHSGVRRWSASPITDGQKNYREKILDGLMELALRWRMPRWKRQTVAARQSGSMNAALSNRATGEITNSQGEPNDDETFLDDYDYGCGDYRRR